MSDQGRVRTWLFTGGSVKRRKHPLVVKPWLNDYGRFRVSLSDNGKRVYRYVHRLVLEAFVGPCPPGMECCHANDDYTDNRLSNLRWDTRKANCADAKRNGVHARGERCGSSKLKEKQVLAIFKARTERDVPLDVLAERYGMSKASVHNIATGKTWGWLTGAGA